MPGQHAISSVPHVLNGVPGPSQSFNTHMHHDSFQRSMEVARQVQDRVELERANLHAKMEHDQRVAAQSRALAEQKIQEQSVEIQKLYAEIDALTQSIDALRHESVAAMHTMSLNAKSEALHAVREKTDALHQELELARQEMDAKSHALAQKDALIQNANQHIHALRAKNQELQDALAQCTEQEEQRIALIDQRVAEMTMEYEQELQKKHQQLQSHQQMTQELVQQTAEAKQRAETCTQELAAAKQAIQEREAAMDTLHQHHFQELHAKHEGILNKHRDAMAELSNLRQQTLQHKSRSQSLQEAMQTMTERHQRDVEALQARHNAIVDEQEQKSKDIVDQLGALQRKLMVNQDIVDRERASKMEAVQRINDLMEKNAVLERELQSLRQKLRSFPDPFEDRIRRTIAEQETRMAQAVQEAKNHHDNHLQSIHQSFRVKLNALENELHAAKDRESKLHKRLVAFQREFVERDPTKLEGMVLSTDKKLKEAHAENESLKKEMRALREEQERKQKGNEERAAQSSAEMKEEHATMLSNMKKLQDKLEETQRERDAISQKLQEEQTRAREQLEARRQKLQELRASVQAYVSEVSRTTEAEKAVLHKKVDEAFEASRQKIEDHRARKQSEMDQYERESERRIQELQALVSQLKEKMRVQEEQLEESKARMDSASQTVMDAVESSSVGAYASMRSEFEMTKNELRKANFLKEDEVGRLAQHRVEKMSRIYGATQRFLPKNKEKEYAVLADMRDALDETQQQIRRITCVDDECTRNQEDAKKKIELAQKLMQALSFQIARLQERHAVLKEASSICQSTKDRLQQDNEAIAQQAQKHQSENATVWKQLGEMRAQRDRLANFVQRMHDAEEAFVSVRKNIERERSTMQKKLDAVGSEEKHAQEATRKQQQQKHKEATHNASSVGSYPRTDGDCRTSVVAPTDTLRELEEASERVYADVADAYYKEKLSNVIVGAHAHANENSVDPHCQAALFESFEHTAQRDGGNDATSSSSTQSVGAYGPHGFVPPSDVVIAKLHAILSASRDLAGRKSASDQAFIDTLREHSRTAKMNHAGQGSSNTHELRTRETELVEADVLSAISRSRVIEEEEDAANFAPVGGYGWVNGSAEDGEGGSVPVQREPDRSGAHLVSGDESDGAGDVSMMNIPIHALKDHAAEDITGDAHSADHTREHSTDEVINMYRKLSAASANYLDQREETLRKLFMLHQRRNVIESSMAKSMRHMLQEFSALMDVQDEHKKLRNTQFQEQQAKHARVSQMYDDNMQEFQDMTDATMKHLEAELHRCHKQLRQALHAKKKSVKEAAAVASDEGDLSVVVDALDKEFTRIAMDAKERVVHVLSLYKTLSERALESLRVRRGTLFHVQQQSINNMLSEQARYDQDVAFHRKTLSEIMDEERKRCANMSDEELRHRSENIRRDIRNLEEKVREEGAKMLPAELAAPQALPEHLRTDLRDVERKVLQAQQGLVQNHKRITGVVQGAFSHVTKQATERMERHAQEASALVKLKQSVRNLRKEVDESKGRIELLRQEARRVCSDTNKAVTEIEPLAQAIVRVQAPPPTTSFSAEQDHKTPDGLLRLPTRDSGADLNETSDTPASSRT